jgi:hypothetical protein
MILYIIKLIVIKGFKQIINFSGNIHATIFTFDNNTMFPSSNKICIQEDFHFLIEKLMVAMSVEFAQRQKSIDVSKQFCTFILVIPLFSVCPCHYWGISEHV